VEDESVIQDLSELGVHGDAHEIMRFPRFVNRRSDIEYRKAEDRISYIEYRKEEELETGTKNSKEFEPRRR
jgi:hypothetical protein